MDPREITAALGREPRFQWKAGDRRVTPTGQVLEGFRDVTYWCANYPDDEARSLADSLDIHVARLRDRKQFLDEFHASGGSAEFFIGWFVDRNSGDELHWTLLGKLTELRVILSFDIYGSAIENTPER